MGAPLDITPHLGRAPGDFAFRRALEAHYGTGDLYENVRQTLYLEALMRNTAPFPEEASYLRAVADEYESLIRFARLLTAAVTGEVLAAHSREMENRLAR
jgi:hypothetical protein